VIAGRTRHAWLRARPTTISAKAMHHELDRRVFLVETIGADRFDLSPLPPNRRSWLAQTGRQQTNQAVARMAPERRYPVLMAFCVEALERCTDDALEVFDRALGAAERAAQRKREELERRGRRDIQTTVRRFIDLSQVVLEGTTPVLTCSGWLNGGSGSLGCVRISIAPAASPVLRTLGTWIS
jgi:hypothetical protein